MTPVLRYRNPGAAARWLCEAFGFHEQVSAQESDQHVKYILLRLGDSCVLVRPLSNSIFDDLMVEPSAIGGGNTHVLYLPVAEAEKHCARAKSAGAKVELEPQDDGLGGRFYTCRDPEGHLWSFGSKDYASAGQRPGALIRVPADGAGPAQKLAVAEAPSGWRRAGNLVRRSLAAAIMLAAVPAGWFLYQTYSQRGFEVGAAVATGPVAGGEVTSERLAAEASRRLAAEEAASEAGAKLNEEKSRRLAAEAALAEAGSKLAQEESRRLAAENLSTAAEAKLGQESARASEARQSAERLQEALARERREAKDALSALEQRQSEQTSQDKQGSARALSALEQRSAEQKANAERLQARLEAVEAEAARERVQDAAAAIAASAEATAAREDVARLEQAQAKQADELEAAYATLKAIRSEIESLRLAQQEAPRPAPSVPGGGIAIAAAEPAPAPPAPGRATTPCAQAVQGKVRLGPQGSRIWPEDNLARLCHGAETSLEPARCFDELMRGKISWGTGSTWTVGHALILCAGTRNARQTLDCFANSIAANETWATAINSCRLAKQ